MTQTPYGHYALSDTKQSLQGVIRALPANYFGKRLGFILRKLVQGKDPVDTDVFDMKVRLHPADNRTEKRMICMPQFFDLEEQKTLAAFAQSMDSFTFIDLGANAGMYSLFMAPYATKIVAVEADPYIYARLGYNLALNPEKTQHITALNMAVSSENGPIQLYINRHNRGESSLTTQSGEAITVQGQTLLSLMNAQNIEAADAVKLDLEGAEEPVLTAFFEEAAPERYPHMIIIEDAPARWQTNLYQDIENAGYSLYFKTRMNRIYLLNEDVE